jgi:hypothetical protein
MPDPPDDDPPNVDELLGGLNKLPTMEPTRSEIRLTAILNVLCAIVIIVTVTAFALMHHAHPRP